MNITIMIDERDLSHILLISRKHNVWIRNDEILLHKEIMKPFNYKLSMDSEKLGTKIMKHMQRCDLKDRLQRAGNFQVGWSANYV